MEKRTKYVRLILEKGTRFHWSIIQVFQFTCCSNLVAFKFQVNKKTQNHISVYLQECGFESFCILLFEQQYRYMNVHLLIHILPIFRYLITAKPKAHAFKNEMCFPLTKTKCELKKHPNSKFECFFNDFNRTKTSLFLPFPSKLIQDNLVCVLELQE